MTINFNHEDVKNMKWMTKNIFNFPFIAWSNFDENFLLLIFIIDEQTETFRCGESEFNVKNEDNNDDDPGRQEELWKVPGLYQS